MKHKQLIKSLLEVDSSPWPLLNVALYKEFLSKKFGFYYSCPCQYLLIMLGSSEHYAALWGLDSLVKPTWVFQTWLLFDFILFDGCWDDSESYNAPAEKESVPSLKGQCNLQLAFLRPVTELRRTILLCPVGYHIDNIGSFLWFQKLYSICLAPCTISLSALWYLMCCTLRSKIHLARFNLGEQPHTSTPSWMESWKSSWKEVGMISFRILQAKDQALGCRNHA